ncbi:hypothetical protein TRIUR3_17127 [Triticum urartu]|uniref:S-acyltransferase n=2 Tax=Triticum TaxID=4564 RepID=A0A9R1NHX7_TRITD|nr:hypothetical protein TRIUR3_17127 [Triticum urartu]VAH25228.1 unnamed protein product [Triticum turgidum subsp. durum]
MAWNVFRFCTALRGLGSIMILLVLAIVGVTYYAVVLCNYGPALLLGGGATLAALAVLLLFHFLLAMLLWSYFSVVFTDPGSVPPNWNLDFDEERGETAPLSSSDFNSQMNPQQSMALGDTGNPRMRMNAMLFQLLLLIAYSASYRLSRPKLFFRWKVYP